jgi:hypothetical protein
MSAYFATNGRTPSPDPEVLVHNNVTAIRNFIYICRKQLPFCLLFPQTNTLANTSLLHASAILFGVCCSSKARAGGPLVQTKESEGYNCRDNGDKDDANTSNDRDNGKPARQDHAHLPGISFASLCPAPFKKQKMAPFQTAEASFISFWDQNIRLIIELLISRGRSIRDSNQHTAAGYLRPDYGFLLDKLCVFRGEGRVLQHR